MYGRGYLAFLNIAAIDQNDALAFVPVTPRAIRQIVAGIQAIFIAVTLIPCLYNHISIEKDVFLGYTLWEDSQNLT